MSADPVDDYLATLPTIGLPLAARLGIYARQGLELHHIVLQHLAWLGNQHKDERRVPWVRFKEQARKHLPAAIDELSQWLWDTRPLGSRPLLDVVTGLRMAYATVSIEVARLHGRPYSSAHLAVLREAEGLYHDCRGLWNEDESEYEFGDPERVEDVLVTYRGRKGSEIPSLFTLLEIEEARLLDRGLIAVEDDGDEGVNVRWWFAGNAGDKGLARQTADRPPALAESEQWDPNCSSVVWYGTRYEFNESQAAAVRLLREAWDNRTLSVSQKAVARALQSENASYRLAHTFRNRNKTMHPAWGTMIVPTKVKGHYMLAAAESREDHGLLRGTRTGGRRQSGHGQRQTRKPVADCASVQATR